MVKSRIFLSCGQRPEERKVVEDIKQSLESEYEVYVATQQHTPEGFKENIFRHLENSEYFLFIDFKREELSGKKGHLCFRGSLFSNQELALASYLGLDILPFQENGVEEHKGIMQFVMANPISFTNKEALPSLVIKEVKKQWKTGWRNQLDLSESKSASHVKKYGEEERPALWFHLIVKNLHKSKQALNCTAFVKEVISNGSDPVTPELSELKWKGMALGQSVVIPPGKERKLDAFHIFDDSPENIILGLNPFLVDSTAVEEEYTLKGPGDFSVRYVLYSDNFSFVERVMTIKIRTNGHNILEFGPGDSGELIEVDLDNIKKEFTGKSSTHLLPSRSIIYTPPTSQYNGSTENSETLDYKDGGELSFTVERSSGSIHSSIHFRSESGTVQPRIITNSSLFRQCPACGAPIIAGLQQCNKCGRILSRWGSLNSE